MVDNVRGSRGEGERGRGIEGEEEVVPLVSSLALSPDSRREGFRKRGLDALEVSHVFLVLP